MRQIGGKSSRHLVDSGGSKKNPTAEIGMEAQGGGLTVKKVREKKSKRYTSPCRAGEKKGSMLTADK